MAIMSHSEWMKQTYGGRLTRRSSKLVAVDQALQNYHASNSEQALQALQAALTGWMQSKGAAWKSSARNKHNAVDSLYKQVTGLGTGQARSPLQLSRVRDESRAIITDLFKDRPLMFRPGLITKLAGNSPLKKASLGGTVAAGGRNVKIIAQRSDAGSAANKSSVAVKASQLADTLMKQVVPSEITTEVMQAMASVMPEFLLELKASCTPIVGLLASGAGVVASAGLAAKSQYELNRGSMHAERTLSIEEPDVAFQAVVRMLQREANDDLAEFARGLTEFGGKVASSLADGGTATNAAIGLAGGLVKLLMILRIVVRDVQERNAANKLLVKPVVTSELFVTCPVMGAYLVCCAPTSVLVNTVLSSDKFYEPGMMDQVERAVRRHIKPLRQHAQRLVKEHRMFIPALQAYPGVLEKNNKNLKAMLKNKGKTGMTGFDSDDFDAFAPATRARSTN